MYEKDNRSFINKISYRSMKANKMRNIFVIVAITLTTVLFTTLFTMGMSMIKSLEYNTMRQVGTSAHGAFKSITKEQLEVLSKDKDIKEYGISMFVAMAENKELIKRNVEIKYFDENDAKYSFVTPLVNGKMPQTENDIVLDTIILDMLGISSDIGQQIVLEYTINGKKFKKDFVLSGYYKGDKVSMTSYACVSNMFIQKSLIDIDVKDSRNSESKFGLVNLDVILNNRFDIENKLINILSRSGFSTKEIKLGVNWAYVEGGLNLKSDNLIPIVGVLLLIMLSGYLIIYNIVYISVVKDICFYGLLKTIGITSRQIKKIILRQAVTLSIIGITVGLAIGYVLGVLFMPLITRITAVTCYVVSASPTIFIGSALFSFITVLISCWSPMKVASRVSPVEAVRYTGVDKLGKKKVKKSSNGAKLNKMAISNLFRNKAKIIISIISLSLSLILFNCIYTVVKGFDLDKYLNKMSGSDFTLGDASFYKSKFSGEGQNTLTDELYYEISHLQGVRNVEKIFFKKITIPFTDTMEKLIQSKMNTIDSEFKPNFEFMLKQRIMNVDIYGLDSGLYDLFDNYIIDGKLNKDLLNSGKYVILGRNRYMGELYKPGDQITFKTYNGESTTYSVMAILDDDLPLYLYNGASIISGLTVYMSAENLGTIVDKPPIMTILFNVESYSIPSINNFLQNKVKQVHSLDYRSRDIYKKEFNEMIITVTFIGYALSSIIALIGLLNFANVMITSVITRRKEFAIMQSIGMTCEQLRRMLLYEGVYYAIATIVISLTVGMLISYTAVGALNNTMAYFTYHITVLPILFCAPFLIGIVVLICTIAFTKTNKISMVERLRAEVI
ncbi:MAG: ABC transporter permease [Solirubrobacterales bacterium]